MERRGCPPYPVVRGGGGFIGCQTNTVNARERERIWELKNKRAKISKQRTNNSIQKSQKDKEMFGSDLLAGDTNLVLPSGGEERFVLG